MQGRFSPKSYYVGRVCDRIGRSFEFCRGLPVAAFATNYSIGWVSASHLGAFTPWAPITGT